MKKHTKKYIAIACFVNYLLLLHHVSTLPSMRETSFLSRLLDLLAPRACAMCGQRLAVDEEVVCSMCNLHLPRTYFWQDAYDNEMARLFWIQLPVERAAAWMFYQPHSQAGNMIYDLKYRSHPETGEMIGRMMAEEMMADGFFEGIDLIVPVPLARKRQRQRGYNQSMEIAKGISQVTRIPIAGDVVRRNSFSESQTRKNRQGRQENVEGAFELVNAEKVSGKHLLIVDDIVTTGATIIACGKELAKARDVKVSIASIGMTKG